MPGIFFFFAIRKLDIKSIKNSLQKVDKKTNVILKEGLKPNYMETCYMDV